MTTSTALVELGGRLGDAAPASASGLVFSAVRFHTVSVWPTSISRAPMFEPMLPMPAMPICIPHLPMPLAQPCYFIRSLILSSAATAQS